MATRTLVVLIVVAAWFVSTCGVSAEGASVEELRQIGFASAAVGTCDNIEYIDPLTEAHVNEIYAFRADEQFASIKSGEAEFEELATGGLAVACVAATTKFRRLLKLKDN